MHSLNSFAVFLMMTGALMLAFFAITTLIGALYRSSLTEYWRGFGIVGLIVFFIGMILEYLWLIINL